MMMKDKQKELTSKKKVRERGGGEVSELRKKGIKELDEKKKRICSLYVEKRQEGREGERDIESYLQFKLRGAYNSFSMWIILGDFNPAQTPSPASHSIFPLFFPPSVPC